MCSLEVPDLAQSIAAPYADNDEVVILLANAGDSENTIRSVLGASGNGLHSLMDADELVYRSYDREGESYAPFPAQVVIDGDGTIRYLAFQYDAYGVRSTINQLLEE